MFPQAYQPGEFAFCDFTRLKRVAITLRGEPFHHLLFHYRLAWSGWAYGQVIHGGESFVALAEVSSDIRFLDYPARSAAATLGP